MPAHWVCLSEVGTGGKKMSTGTSTLQSALIWTERKSIENQWNKRRNWRLKISLFGQIIASDKNFKEPVTQVPEVKPFGRDPLWKIQKTLHVHDGSHCCQMSVAYRGLSARSDGSCVNNMHLDLTVLSVGNLVLIDALDGSVVTWRSTNWLTRKHIHARYIL